MTCNLLFFHSCDIENFPCICIYMNLHQDRPKKISKKIPSFLFENLPNFVVQKNILHMPKKVVVVV